MARPPRRVRRSRGESLRHAGTSTGWPPTGRPIGRSSPAARVLAHDGDLEGAGRALDAATKLAPAGALRDWDIGQAHAAREEGRHDLALWHLGRVLAANPDDGRTLVERSRTFGFAGQEDRAEADLDRAIALATGPTIVTRFADRMATEGRWRRAASIFAQVDRRLPDAPDVIGFHRAVASLMAGDQPGYRDACSRLLARSLRRDTGVGANDAVYACALGPRALDDYAPAIALQSRLLGAIPPANKNLRHIVLNTLGAILFRSGDHAAAVARLREGVDAVGGDGVDEDWIFLALAASAGGEPDAARGWFKRISRPGPTPGPFGEAILGLIRREVESVLGPNCPMTCSIPPDESGIDRDAGPNCGSRRPRIARARSRVAPWRSVTRSSRLMATRSP